MRGEAARVGGGLRRLTGAGDIPRRGCTSYTELDFVGDTNHAGISSAALSQREHGTEAARRQPVTRW
jgi:hypothetical protein